MSKKGKTFELVKEALPQLSKETEVESASDKLDDLKALEAIQNMSGTKYLIKEKQKDIVGLIALLITKIKSEHTHQELISIISRIDAKLDVILDIKNASKNAENQEQLLDSIIKEMVQE